MYQKLIKKIIKLGDSLPVISGYIIDIEKNKNWLTEKDVEIEMELADIIKTFPGKHIIFGEELYNTFTKEDNVWIIDAISSTLNFLHGFPHYAIILSHLYKGKIKFAVIYDPSTKELFTAYKDRGAFLNNKRIHVSRRETDLFFMIGPYLIPPRKYRKKLLKILETMSEKGHTVRILGSLGINYAYVACGRADVAISFNEDTFPEFAGKLLVEEAGGKFTDFKGGTLNIKTKGIIASNSVVHQKIGKIIRDIV